MEKDVVRRLECPRFGRCLLFLYGAPIQNGTSMRKKINIVYPNIPSAIRPVPHGDGLPVPEPPDNFAMYSDDDDSVSSNSKEQQPSASRDADYLPSTDSSIHKITDGELMTSSGI